jgi:hypothetical protein
VTHTKFSPDLTDHVQRDPLGREVVPLATMAVFWGISAQEAQAEYDRQMAEDGQFCLLQSWYDNAKALQAKYGTADARELFKRIVLDGGAK